MGPAIQLLSVVALLGAAHPTDTITYADRATRDLVARAMSRHGAQDTTVRDYAAKLRYRLSFGFGKRRWADVPPVAAEEQEGRLTWQLPNDLRVDLQGRRSASRIEDVDLTSSFGRPWFVPRTLGDSIRVFGSDAPEKAAPHPLSRGGEAFYHYAATDSITITTGGKQVRIRGVTVTPKRASGAYVTGKLWIDMTTGDVARFTFRFVGDALWSRPDGATAKDSADSRRESRMVSRIVQLDADLEYSLQDNTHWMPYRQVLSGRVMVPFGVDVVVPFEARTTFDEYEINTGARVVFDAPFPDSLRERSESRETREADRDSVRRERRDGAADSLLARDRTGFLANGGRYQIHRPPVDSLRAYASWGDSLELGGSDADRDRLRTALAEVARMAEDLPPEMTGRPGPGIAWERIPEMVRYNRVQGLSLGIMGRTRTPLAFTELFGSVRGGMADERIMARVAAVRDAPGGRTTIAVARDLIDIDPFARGLSFSNSLRGMLVSRDDGDYALAQGVRITHETSIATGRELTIGVSVEDHQAARTRAGGGLPRIFGADGPLPANPPVREGLAVGARARVDHLSLGMRWSVTADAISVDGEAGARVATEVRIPDIIARTVSGVFRAGVASTSSLPQVGLAAGGLNSVRGYDHGVARGDAMWSAQLEAKRPGRGAIKPVVFADVGQAGLLDAFGDAPLLAGVGVGVSIAGGVVRADLSHPITERHGRGLRFDLIFAMPW